MASLSGQCGICCGSLVEVVSLGCGHIYCRECLLGWVEHLIGTGKLGDKNLICPTEECSFLISDWQGLEEFLGQEKYMGYCEQVFQTDSVSCLKSGEVLVNCFAEGCKTKWMIWEGAEYQTCPVCMAKHCRKCKQRFHWPLDCKKARNSYFASKVEGELYKAAKQLGFAQCPVCLVMVEKTDMCNVIKCASEKCYKNKTEFCYLCEEQLKQEVTMSNYIEKDHFKHYRDDNPFGSKCRLWDPDSKKWVDRLPSTKEIWQNQKPCPKCGTLKKEECEVLENFKGQLCFCRSDKCNGKLVCLVCKKTLKEKDVASHFDYDKEFAHVQGCQIQ